MSAPTQYVCAGAGPAKDAVREPLRRHVFFGTALLSTASITKLALQCTLIPVLARLLGPQIFGLMSVAMSFVLLANMLSDGGMGAALIREHKCDHELESTVYWLSVLIGLALASVVCLIAWPVAVVYHQPLLLSVMLALSPILIVSSSLCVPNARIIRSQRFDIFAIGDVCCAVVSAAVGLLLAFAGYGIWSLVWQQLSFWATKAIWISRSAGFKPARILRLKSARPLLRFSANTLASNIADFVSKNFPILIVGGTLGVASVARYAMAYQLTRVAETVVSDPVNLATFSAVANARRRREATEFVITALKILLLVLLPLFCGLALTADLLAPIVLGQRWIGTGPALAVLAPGALFFCLYRFATGVLLGKGLSGRAFKLTLLTGAATTLGTLLGVHAGVTGAVAGLSIGAASVAPLYLWSLARPLNVPVGALVAAGRTSVMATAVMAAAMLLLRWQVHDAVAPYIQLILAIGTGAASFIAAAMLLGGREIRAALRMLRNRSHTENVRQPSAWPFLPTPMDEAEPAV
ncbi:MAG: lipopolysaccharide biosynthesis protein [Alphaproteobacteria bacterium]|nr:lipopolysaccharide biosynthesis protein [Alphaproteobacteria bacterium]MBV9693890.1 lipopolysaccharide biosynthesis protein [Alphaproteobacteria bacterium]